MVRTSPSAALPDVNPLTPDDPAACPAGPGEVIRRVSSGDVALEDYRPLPLNLEWRLSDAYWAAEGVAPFITDAVPYLVNNDGRASTDAAAVLFANCVEAAPEHGTIRILEIGAGTALFARYLLDEFRDLCQRHGRDFYNRLSFHVSDRSPRTVQHWSASGVFGEHAARVTTSVCDAARPVLDADRPLRAVFANYVLDSLPAAVLRRSGSGWQRLCARATIRDEGRFAFGHGRSIDWMRTKAQSDRIEDLIDLLPLLSFLDAELAFLDMQDAGPPDWEHAAEDEGSGEGSAIVHNYGAEQCLDTVLQQLDRQGFILIRDYGHTAEQPLQAVGAQRFGGATALPIDFVRLERRLRARAVEVVFPDRENLMHTRLLTRDPIPHSRRAFAERFGTPASARWDAVVRARQLTEQGLFREALDAYRRLIDDSPRDWRVLGEAAQLAAASLGDPTSGLELARIALTLNPWYSPFLWNVQGDCLAALDRVDAAHESYEQAMRLYPAGVDAHLRLAKSWLRLGDASRSLESVARGLANDADDTYRHELLDCQQAAIDALSRGRVAQRETLHRRSARTGLLSSRARPGGEGG